MSIDNVFKRIDNKNLTGILFLLAQAIFTINYLRLPAFGFVGLLKALMLPAILLAFCIAINMDIFKDIEWRKAKPTVSHKVMIFFLLGFLGIFSGLSLLTINLHIPLVMLIVCLSISYLWMLYFEFSGNLDKAVYIFFICFPLLNLAEYWLGITKQTFEGGIVFTPTVFFLLSLFLGIFIQARANKIVLSRIQIAAFICLGVFLLSGLVSASLSIAPWESFCEYILQYIYPMLMLPIVFLSINSIEKIKKCINILILSSTFNVVLFFYLFQRFGQGVTNIIDVYGASLTSGISSGTMGNLVLFIFPLILFMIFTERNNVRRCIYGVVFLLGSFLLTITFSRSDLISFLLGTMVFVFTRKIKESLIIIAIVGLLLAAISFLLLGDAASNRYLTILSGFKDISSQARLNAWSGAVDMIKDYPIFGIGAGMWDKYVSQYVPTQHINFLISEGKWAKGYIVDPHNLFLKIYLEAGIVGFLSWIGFIVVSITGAFTFISQSFSKSKYMFYLGIVFLAFIIANSTKQMSGWRFVNSEGIFLSSLVYWGINGLFFRAININETK